MRKNIKYIAPIVLGCFLTFFIQDFQKIWLRHSALKQIEEKSHMHFCSYDLLYKSKLVPNEIINSLQQHIPGWNMVIRGDKVLYSLHLFLSEEEKEDRAYQLSNMQNIYYPHLYLKEYEIQKVDSGKWECKIVLEGKLNEFL